MTTIRPASTLLIAAALVLAACSGSDEVADATSDDVTTVAATTAATPPPTSEPAPVTTVAATTATTTAAPTTTPTTTPATTAPSTTTAPEWAPVGPGAFSVGVTTVTIDDPSGERPMTVDVWFPLTDAVDTAALEPHRYTLLPGVYYESPNAFTAEAVQLRATETYPLVVYSHGSGGIRYIHSSYTEAIASHGYVVVAPDHTGNTVLERFSGAEVDREIVVFDRPNDLDLVIDAFVDPSHPTAGPFAAAVDAERIAVTGHSFGGYTSTVMATGVTTSFGEVGSDERVDAIALLAPAVSAELVPDDRISSLEVPMMIVVGTNDESTPIDPNVTRLWDLADNSPAYRVELVDGAHQTFTDLCAYRDFLPTLENVPEIITTTITEFGENGCSPGDIDAERAADITNTYVVQFLDQVFRDGPAIDPASAPADVIFDAR